MKSNAKPKKSPLQILFRKFLDEYYKADGVNGADWADIECPTEAPLRNAIQEAVRGTPRSKQTLEISAVFFMLIDEPENAIPALERWADAAKKDARPLALHAQYFFEDRLDYVEFLKDIGEALSRSPKSPRTLGIAYSGARQADDTARRLLFAGEMAEASREADHLFLYGVELGRNGLLDKAEKIFRSGVRKDPRHVGCINGLAYCFLQRLELDEADEHFRKSLAIEETPVARKSLKVIEQLRSGKNWSERQKRQKKAWQDWAEAASDRLARSEQKRRIATLLAEGLAQKTP